MDEYQRSLLVAASAFVLTAFGAGRLSIDHIVRRSASRTPSTLTFSRV